MPTSKGVTRRSLLVGGGIVAFAPLQQRALAWTMSPTTAKLFVTKGLHKATERELEQWVCSDDRPDGKRSGVSLFGANGGTLVNALAIGRQLRENRGVSVDYDKIIRAVLATVGGSARFCYHTDEKTPGKDGAGCAHCRQVQMQPGKYGMDKDLGRLFVQTLVSVEAEPDVLVGRHNPTAFIAVRHLCGIGKDGSGAVILDHRLKIDGVPTQAFVYSADLVERHLRHLAHNMHEHVHALQSFDVAELHRLLIIRENLNMRRTLGIVAKGLPAYTAWVDRDRRCRIMPLTF